VAESKATDEPPGKQIRDWLLFAFALIGMALGVFNYFTSRWDRERMEQIGALNTLENVSNALAELAPEGTRSRKEDLLLLRVEVELQQALQADPHSSQLRRMLAEFLFLSGRRPDAFRSLEEAIGDAPRDCLLYTEQGRLYQKDGQLMRALDSYSKGIQNKGAPHADYHAVAVAYTNRGTVYFKQRKLREALEDFKEAIGMHLNDKSVCENLMKIDPSDPAMSDPQLQKELLDIEKQCKGGLE
jgi:tetratricopeptide (TPR) repeat protein